MNEDKWVLAVLKRYLLEKLGKSNPYDAIILSDIIREVLDVIIRAEADSILGTPSMIEDYVDSLFPEDIPEEDCNECKVVFDKEEEVS